MIVIDGAMPCPCMASPPRARQLLQFKNHAEYTAIGRTAIANLVRATLRTPACLGLLGPGAAWACWAEIPCHN